MRELHDSRDVFLIAADPATPPELLEGLSRHEDQEVRRAVALNPNTPLQCLLQLADDFPDEFLRNPALMLWQLERPDFCLHIPRPAWLPLLNSEHVPHHWVKSWLKQLGKERWSENNGVAIESIMLHMSLKPQIPQEYIVDYAATVGEALWKTRMPGELLGETWNSFNTSYCGERLREEIVQRDTISESFLQGMEQVRRQGLKKMLARERTTPVTLLRTLSKDPSIFVQVHAARNAATPIDVLEHLVEVGEDAVRAAVAENPAAPLHVLTKLAKHPQFFVRAAVAKNQALPISLFEELMNDEDNEVRKAVASNPAAPERILRFMAERAGIVLYEYGDNHRYDGIEEDEEGYSILEALASNPATPEEILEELAVISDIAVLKNPALPLDLRIQLLEELGGQDAMAEAMDVAVELGLEDGNEEDLSRDENTPAEKLAELAESWGESEVVEAVAQNKATPVFVLERLAKHASPYIRESVAMNKAAPIPILATLIGDEDISVREAAAKTALRRDIWEHLAAHAKSEGERGTPADGSIPSDVRRLIEGSLALLQKQYWPPEEDKPDWVWQEKREDEEGSVAAIVRLLEIHPREAIVEAMERSLVHAVHWQHRCVLAMTAGVAGRTLETLAHDSNYYVREVARYHMSAMQSS